MIASFQTAFADTVFSDTPFVKSYPILQQYYRIGLDGGSSLINTSLVSRLEVSQGPLTITDSCSAFINEKENKYDAFGKLRVSTPFTILDVRVPGQSTGASEFLKNSIQLTNNLPVAGGSIVSHNSTATLALTGAGTVINQSLKYCTYQPGKSFLVMMTAILNPGNANPPSVVSSVGYFDDFNGLNFSYVGATGCSINLINQGSYTSYPQSSWNVDPMDGTVPSRVLIDFRFAQIFVIDLEWLGTGRIRFGFYTFGRVMYCHEIINLNNLSNGPYTANINLPLRWQLNSSSGSGSLIQICGTVISEGGYSPTGRAFSTSIGQLGNITSPTGTTEKGVLFLRGGGNNYYHQQIIPTQVSIGSTSTSDVFIYRLRLYLPGQYSGDTITWVDVNSDYSVAQYGTASPGTSLSGTNIIIDSVVASGRGSSSIGNLSIVFSDIEQIAADVANNSSIIALTVQGNFAANSKIYATLSWLEVY